MSKEKNTPPTLFYICTGDKCKKRGSKEISRMLNDFVDDHGMRHVGIINTHCTDNCKHGPVVCCQPDNAWYFHVDGHKAINLLKKFSGK